MNRRWIGIDVAKVAIDTIKSRLERDLGPGVADGYEVHAEPASVEDALALAAEDKYEFQWWALRQIGASPAPRKKGADRGIDGRVYFHEVPGGDTEQAVVSVKGGNTGPSHVRDLRGVIEREKAALGFFICIKQPTKAMLAEANEAGFYYSEAMNREVPRLQVLTVADLLADKGFLYPYQVGVPAPGVSVPHERPVSHPGVPLSHGEEAPQVPRDR